MTRTMVLLFCSAVSLLLTGCDNCQDCLPTTTYVYSVANLAEQPITMIFYPNPQLLPREIVRVEIAKETTVRLHEVSTYQSSGPLKVPPGESDGQRGQYDSLIINFPTDRILLTHTNCADIRNALCLENYEVSEHQNLVEYTLLIDE